MSATYFTVIQYYLLSKHKTSENWLDEILYLTVMLKEKGLKQMINPVHAMEEKSKLHLLKFT